MGAGNYPAGVGPAGFDPIYLPAPAGAVFTPRAVKYDPARKRFTLTDASGNNVDVHPTDQIVVGRFFYLPTGSIVAKIRKRVARVDPAKIPAIVNDEVRTGLADLIRDNSILLVSVVTSTAFRGRVEWTATYVNLRDPATPPRNPLSNAVTVRG